MVSSTWRVAWAFDEEDQAPQLDVMGLPSVAAGVNDARRNWQVAGPPYPGDGTKAAVPATLRCPQRSFNPTRIRCTLQRHCDIAAI